MLCVFFALKHRIVGVHPKQNNSSCVFGMAYGYSVESLSPFILSLRKTGYSGCILLGAKFPVTEDLENFAREHNITLKHIIQQISQKGRKSCSLCSLGLASSRYMFYLDWLEELDENISSILITDVRDVVFQTDPFIEFLSHSKSSLNTFEESFNFSIDTKWPFKVPWNRNWIIEGYGVEGLKKIGAEIILCSGTTIGTYDGIKHYLMEMKKELSRFRRPCSTNRCCECKESKGFDQGVHNFLVQTGKITDVSRERYGDSYVLTLGSIRYTDHTITLDSDGYMLNSKGERVSILHQYNRLSLKMKWLIELIDSNKSNHQDTWKLL